MFGIKIQGRLGNQMFQYAFAVANKMNVKQNFFLDGYKLLFWNKGYSLPKYFNINSYNSIKNFCLKFYFYCQHKFRPTMIIQDQWSNPDEFLKVNTKDEVLYSGFFQSEKYFEDCQPQILREFTVKKKYTLSINDFTGNDKESVVIHWRRGDYINFGNDELGYNLSLPKNYYNACLGQLDLSNKNIIFLSDDIKYVKEVFTFPDAIYSENNTEINDLQLIMQADYLILSNSSFSWWGAYLNIKAKQIFAPKYWLGFKVKREWPNAVVSVKWQTVDVIE